MTIRRYFPARVLLLIVLGAGLVALIRLTYHGEEDPGQEVIQKARHLMGTLWEIQVVVPPGRELEEIESVIFSSFKEIDRIEQIMSEWIPESPISQINRSAGRKGPAAPEELLSIIKRGIEYGDLTQGVFDITWRGLAGLWVFGGDFAPPSEIQIAEALEKVDYRQIRIRDSTVSLPPDFSIGLGGIAKGYAVDQAAKVLRRSGLDSFLINGGGDILTSGKRISRPWTIGVQAPRGNRDELVAKVDASNRAVVTSGDYERYLIYQGIRYHHILDPRTGKPAMESQSATVVAPTAEEADVLATAVFILGHEKGFRLISGRKDTEALVIDSEGRFWLSSGFRELAEFY